MDTNPILGTGFESFWLGERVQTIWAQIKWRPNQAHNGYLEMYLNLGAVGLCIFLGVIIATFRKIRLDLLTDFDWGRLRMCLLVAILAHNWTEAGFRGLKSDVLYVLRHRDRLLETKSSRCGAIFLSRQLGRERVGL